jgi:hypothetical protein
VALCAVSKNLRLRDMMTSSLLDCAFLAASWAARRRATRCSGVSPASRGDEGGGGCRPPPAAGGNRDAEAAGLLLLPAVREKRPEEAAAVCDVLLDDEAREGEDELLDSAWGVVDVNRVASETDRGPVVLIAIVERSCCFRLTLARRRTGSRD